jgi:FkbM family methyltransferase
MSVATVKSAITRRVARYFPGLWMERELRFRPNHFEPEFWLVSVFCSPAHSSIDIGANVGVYSYYMAKFSKNVIAFEPNRDLWSGLARLLPSNVRLESAALSRVSSKAVIRIDSSNAGVATIEESNDLCCVADKSVVVNREVETRTLDSFNFTDIAMIKIDVEGHEEAVIEGAHDTLVRNQPVLLIESEDRHKPGAPRRLAEFLATLGYLGFYLKDSRLTPVSELRPEDTDPRNLETGLRPYINNFIFIPASQPEKIELANARLARR